MNRKKIKNLGFGILAAMLTLTAARSSIAYLTQKEQAVNVFTVGDLELGLREPEWDPDEGDGGSMVPGSSVYKNPTIKILLPIKTANRAAMCVSFCICGIKTANWLPTQRV